MGLVILGAGAAWAAGVGPFRAGDATPRPSATAIADRPTPSPSSRVTAAPAITAAPVTPDPGARYGSDEDVATLIGLVPATIADTCSSAEVFGLQVAAVQCATSGVSSVFYELYLGSGDLDSDWISMLDAQGLTADSGDCASGKPGESLWYFTTNGTAGPEQGRDACYVDGTTATFLWTDVATNTRSWLVGAKDTGIEALYQRWAQGDLNPARPGG